MEVTFEDGGPTTHHVWPDGCVSLAVRLPRSGQPSYLSLVGPRHTAFTVPVRGGDRFAGVRLWPDRGGALLGVDPARLRDHIGPAEAVGAPRLRHSAVSFPTGGDMAAALGALATITAGLALGAPPRDDAIRAGVMAIIESKGTAPIPHLAAAVGLGERQFQRRFRRAVGLTPKQFARIRRLRSTGGRLLDDSPRWAMLAADAGFADQPHLIREFHMLTGLTPEEFRSRLRTIEHIDVRP